MSETITDAATIEEMNKVIADFMGFDTVWGEKPYFPFYKPDGMSDREYAEEISIAENKLAEWEYHNRLQYNGSWDWLMPVVEKIWKMGKMVSLNLFTDGGGFANSKIYNWELGAPYQESESQNMIESVHQCVYEFIIYHNQITNS